MNLFKYYRRKGEEARNEESLTRQISVFRFIIKFQKVICSDFAGIIVGGKFETAHLIFQSIRKLKDETPGLVMKVINKVTNATPMLLINAGQFMNEIILREEKRGDFSGG